MSWESLKKLQVVSLIGNNIISARISALPNLRCIDITTNKLSFASTIAVNAMRQKLPNATIKASMPRFMPQLDSMLLFLHFSRVVQQLFKTKRSFEILFNLLLMFSPDKNSKDPKIPFDIINMIVAYLLPFNIERVIERELGNFRTSFAARNGRENQSNTVSNQILTSFVSSQLSVPKLVEVAKLKAISDLSNEMQEVRALRINRQRVAIATEEPDIENQRLTRPLLSG